MFFPQCVCVVHGHSHMFSVTSFELQCYLCSAASAAQLEAGLPCVLYRVVFCCVVFRACLDYLFTRMQERWAMWIHHSSRLAGNVARLEMRPSFLFYKHLGLEWEEEYWEGPLLQCRRHTRQGNTCSTTNVANCCCIFLLLLLLLLSPSYPAPSTERKITFPLSVKLSVTFHPCLANPGRGIPPPWTNCQLGTHFIKSKNVFARFKCQA